MTRWMWCGVVVCLVSANGSLEAQSGKRLAIGSAEIDYYGVETDNAFHDLMTRVADGATKLDYHPTQGYLPGLLEALRLPVESQLLLFSKSSLQAGHIGPQTPRAFYFNDEVILGWIPGAPLIELMAQDPVKGTIFYAIPQDDTGFHPRREERCNGCHAIAKSGYVPGFLVRSFETTERGGLVSGRAKVTQATPIELRWGGWYITGETPRQPHRGNLRGSDEFARQREEPLYRGAVADLAPLVDLSAYPVATSDIAAALVLDHQSETYNLLVRGGHEARLGQDVTVLDELVTALLTLDEVPLNGPIRGIGGFTERYAAGDVANPQGTALKQLDLESRVYHLGVSPLVFSRTFQRLPDGLRTELQQRIVRLLEGATPWPETAAPRSAEVRQAALAVLRAGGW